MKKLILVEAAFVLTMIFFLPRLKADANKWGRLANPGFENQPIKSCYFFTGNQRNGSQYYEYNPSPNTGIFTIHPSDSRHLNWSEGRINQEFAVNCMIDAGANVINMSYWGPRGTDNWAWWAPMQTSTYSHDELYNITQNKHILIAPYIESCAETPHSPGFTFMDDFPGTTQNPAPELVTRIFELVDRYLLNPQQLAWRDKWAQVYDQSGQKRYLVSIIHVASNQDNMTDLKFAQGFDRVAQKVYQERNVLIGFTIDALPPISYAGGFLKATPQKTGPSLAQQASLLGVQCFIPEIWTGQSDENSLLRWKRTFSSDWINTGIPFIQDVSPGYDAHIVFPGSPVSGNNDLWRNGQTQIVQDLNSQGITFNAWNGYTEGFAGVPTVEYGDDTYKWISYLFKGFNPDGVLYIPGKIEAEEYAQMSGVQTENTSDYGGGLNVGWIDDGDWMDYLINVKKAGLYDIALRVALDQGMSPGQGQFKIGEKNIMHLYHIEHRGLAKLGNDLHNRQS
ncbi:carbohydrate-binding protein [candidate division KSB1 bacterium]|nr:carbohydrate-binding protein [candidate division KSB1 bacterium]